MKVKMHFTMNHCFDVLPPNCTFTLQLPAFFMKSHDYTMYSNDVEFINGLLNTKTR